MKLPKKLFLPTIFLYFVPPLQPPAGSRTGGQTSKKLP